MTSHRHYHLTDKLFQPVYNILGEDVNFPLLLSRCYYYARRILVIPFISILASINFINYTWIMRIIKSLQLKGLTKSDNYWIKRVLKFTQGK